MRYYFHLRIGDSISPDEIGLEIADLETAYLEAFKAAQEMWAELISERCDPLIRSFEIADEHGRVLLTLPFREVLERARGPAGTLAKLAQTLKAELEKRKMLTVSLGEQIKQVRKTVETTRKSIEETSNLLDGPLATLHPSNAEAHSARQRQRAIFPAAENKMPPTILVVEDEVLVRMMITDQLRNAGYSVVEAASAQEALDVLAHTSEVELILSDIRMPGSMTGVGLARFVRSEYPRIKVLLTSGHPPPIEMVEHDGFFPKPYHPAGILRQIKTLVGGGTSEQSKVVVGSRER
jgi:CheY-like chemotaxis protein